MALPLQAPVLGPDREPGSIVQWYRDDGSEVEPGDPVFCFESGFVTVEVEAESSGRLHRCFPPGTLARPGNVVALLLDPGEAVPEHDEDPLHGVDVTPAARPEDHDREPILLPLRRGAIKEPPRPTPGGAWDRAFGTSGHDYRGFWPLRDETPPAEAEPAADAVLAEDEPAALNLDGQATYTVAAYDETPDDLDYGQESLEGAGHYHEQQDEPVLAATGDVGVAAHERPTEATPEWQSAITYVVAAPLVVRGSVRLTELRKMCEQLSREWRDSGIVPRNEDLVLRAAARAALGNPAVAGIGDDAALVTPAPGEDHVAVLRGAGRGALREQVSRLTAAANRDEQPAFAFTVSTFADFGIDEAVPVLPDGHVFAFAMGATRPGNAMEDGIPAPVMTLTLAYSPDRMSQGDAAALFARVRELIEAPYALLAD
jgi:pyruvate/2-oxoglutarate dehydrogenase complex dihydrolipoamide acyltransferase (E2) component